METIFPAASLVSVYDTDLAKWHEVVSQDVSEYWVQCGHSSLSLLDSTCFKLLGRGIPFNVETSQ